MVSGKAFNRSISALQRSSQRNVRAQDCFA